MERASLAPRPTSSRHSFQDGSEIISEVEETNEIKALQKLGENDLLHGRFKEALQHYDDALDIDDDNVTSLAGKATALLEMAEVDMAKQTISKLLALEASNIQGLFLLAKVLKCEDSHEEAIRQFMDIISMVPQQPEYVRVVANEVVHIASTLCNFSEDLKSRILGMEDYYKLCEVGCLLYQNKLYESAAKILSTSRKIDSNLPDVTQRLLLTLGNCYAALKQKNQAIVIYQDCLKEARLANNDEFATKALVNLASLCLELGHTHDAIIYYKKLLNAHSNLLESDCQPPAYWNEKLHFAIHLNLSIAYKTVGRITDALEHALIYVKLTEPLMEDKSLVAQAYCNAGTLFDMLGKPHEAMDFYKKYLQACKQDGGKNKRAQAQAYGCLGSSYAQLGNETMAVTMHQQQLSAIKQFHDHTLTAVAYELLGDSFMSLENWSKAAESYDTAIKCLKSDDVKAKAAMLCKLGNAYRQQRLCGHALQAYEQAEKLSRDSSQFNVSVVSKLNIAICLQESSRMQELERALEYFDFVLPILEAKRCQHYEEDTFCPSQLNTQLRDCYNGMQAVYGRLDKKARCLEVAETFRRKELEAYITGSVSCALCSPGDEGRTIECLTGIVDRQDSVIVYYSVLPIGLLIWVLKPGEGLARFYMKRNEKNDTPVAEVLRKLMKELIKDLSLHVSTSAMSSENRSLPFRNTDLLIERKENKSFSTASRRECIAAELDSEMSSPGCQQEQPSDDSAKPRSISRQLFSILLAPVYDLLFSLPAGSPVTFIPDDILCNCPFHVLEDWSGVQLESKFRITIAPCLLAVNKCFDNEMNFRTREDNLLLDRQQARHGGPVIASILDATTLAKAHEPLPSSRKLLPSLTPRANGASKPNSKTLSNPRLSRSTPLPNPSAIKKVTPQNYNDSHALAKALGTHTVSTLCVRTETNTDIIRSDLCVHEFRQVSNKQRVAVIGSPVLKGKFKLDGKVWQPWTLREAQFECEQVAEYCGPFPHIGLEATKQKFFEVIDTATVLHIATFGDMERGCLAFVPDQNQPAELQYDESGYLVSAADIANRSCTAKLVVLSTGRGSHQVADCDIFSLNLSSAFIAAGSQCVLTQLWPLPDAAVQKFYYHFYTALHTERFVSEAVTLAVSEVVKDDRFQPNHIWSAFVLIGRDVRVCLPVIQRAMLDQFIDNVEKQTTEKNNKDPLNPTYLPRERTTEEEYHLLQQCLSAVLASHHCQPELFAKLRELLSDSLKRLQSADLARCPQLLPSSVHASVSTVALLRRLGFHFQPQVNDSSTPYIVFPQSRQNGLLQSALSAVETFEELGKRTQCLWSVSEVLPMPQTLICHLVDLLCLTKHAEEVQVKVTDDAVKKLWTKAKVRTFLHFIGFYQIGVILHFNGTNQNEKLLTAALQLFLALSTSKSSTLLQRLDPQLFGVPDATSTIPEDDNKKNVIRLPTLTPLLLPRSKIQLSNPWLTKVEADGEMNEKLELALGKSDIDSTFNYLMEHTKSWHHLSLSEMSKTNMLSQLEPLKRPSKVKVITGSTASQTRIPVGTKPPKTLAEQDNLRNASRVALDERLHSLNTRRLTEVHKLYLPYAQS